MTNRSTRYRRYLLVAVPVLLAGVAACNELAQSPDAPTAATPVAFSQTDGVDAQLAQLRSIIAPFHNFEKANDAEYNVPLLKCMVDPTLGGMGFHFGKGSAIDGTVNPLEPEVLLYEPETNGQLRLVAVEFIVPFALVPRNGPAPRAYEQDFIPNDGLGLWTLHAWIFKHNPSGMFASWNPEVNCDAVPVEDRELMSHSN